MKLLHAKMGGKRVEIFSTWYFDEEKIKELSLDVMTDEVKRAESITIISAYYSVSFIKKLLCNVNKTKRRKCTLNLIFNGFGGQRLYDQIKELKNLTFELKKLKFSKISIYLNKETTLFHTKLYLIENDSGLVWFGGSANASFAAFEKNEEILFKSRVNIKKIRIYMANVIANSELIENIHPDELIECNIIGFFRTGSIYFKPNNQLSFTFSDFKLPNSVEKNIRVVNKQPRNTNPGKAWGAYNLKLSLGLRDDENEENTQVSLKPCSIETCYGYWVPRKYKKIVDKSIKQKAKNTEGKLLEVLNLINSRGFDSLLEDYRYYLIDAKGILALNKIDYVFDENELISKYEKFIERIHFKLSDQERLKKLCLPLVSTGMPEIWEDNIAYKDFSESFYEYIANSLTSRMPRVVRSIMEGIDFSPESDSNDIASRFNEYFESEEAEWSDDYWRE